MLSKHFEFKLHQYAYDPFKKSVALQADDSGKAAPSFNVLIPDLNWSSVPRLQFRNMQENASICIEKVAYYLYL